MTFTPADPDFRARVRADFDRQTFLTLLGVRMAEVEPGTCTLEMTARPDLCQQHGFIHAGVTTTLADVAAGYAAHSLMPADAEVLTVEFKTNFMNPGQGERLIARGRVEKAGRTLTVVRSDVVGVTEGVERPIATMLATMICLRK